MSRFALTALAAAASAVVLMGVSPGPQPPADNKQLAHDIFKELVEIHSSDTIGTKEIADAIAARLLGGGFAKSDIHDSAGREISQPGERRRALSRQGQRQTHPLELPYRHRRCAPRRLDDYPPFKFTEKDGYFYGRGTSDMKDQDAAVLATLHPSQEGRLRSRSRHHRGFHGRRRRRLGAGRHGAISCASISDLVDAALAINPDGDSGEIDHNSRVDYGVETSQKTYVTYTLTVTNKGGHSSEPRPDNAIYRSGERARALLEISVPDQDECDDAALFRTHGAAADRDSARPIISPWRKSRSIPPPRNASPPTFR